MLNLILVSLLSLVYELHFVEEMLRMSDVLDGEEQVADIERDVPAEIRTERDVAHRSFPYAVEIDSDEVAVRIDYRAS